MTAHRTLDGDWAECTAPDTCPLLFHFPEMTPEQMAATPLRLLLPLFEIVDPPQLIGQYGEKIWEERRHCYHRDYDLPAVIFPGDKGAMEWRWHGKIHRDHDRPAEVGADWAVWRIHGQVHRDGDKPAEILADGTKLWYSNNNRHRDGGQPAVLYVDGRVEYWRNGNRYPSPPRPPHSQR